MKRRCLGLLIACALTSGAVACSMHPREQQSQAALEARYVEFARTANSDYAANLRDALAHMEVELDRPRSPIGPALDVLIMHGGGPAGAFAAGFLAGWGRVDDPALARPEFDHVTGSSSGALIAPLAFIGDESAYRRVAEIFCNLPGDLFDLPGPFALWPTRRSLLSGKRLADLVQQEMSVERIEQIAAAAEAHRVLLVATTDLDLGEARIWDMGLEARRFRAVGDPERFRSILLASASLPVILPPVEIDGSLHTDGGVALSFFPGFGEEGVASLVAAWRERHPGVRMPRLRVWLIFSQKLVLPVTTVQPRYLDVALRSVDVAMKYDRLKALSYVAKMIQDLNDLEEVDAEFRWVAIPSGARIPTRPDEYADSAVIRGLVETGARLGADPRSWNEGPPALEWLAEEPLAPPEEPAESEPEVCSTPD